MQELVLWSLAIEYCKDYHIGYQELHESLMGAARNSLWAFSYGHDTIRAIRFYLEKIKKYYVNLINAYRRRKEQYKTNVWDTEEKRLKYVDG